MRFSILIPVYNVKKYISQCFDSILSQTFKDFEVIIVDDGSTDGSGDECDKFAKEHGGFVRVIHKENGGLISARRTAIAEARGDYCVFLDSDDMLSGEYLERADRALRAYSNPDMLICSFLYIDDDGNTSVPSYGKLDCNKVISDREKKELFSKMICSTELDSLWTKVIRTCLLKDDPTDYTKYYKYNMSEDLLQSLFPVTKAERIVCIEDRLYLYRYNPSSISRSVSVDSMLKNSTLHVYDEIKKYLPEWGMNTDEWEKKLDANFLSQTAYSLDRFYLASKDDKTREAVLSADWKSLVSSSALKDFENNPYLSDAYKTVWKMIVNGDKPGLKRYFTKKKIYTGLKRIKRKITG